MLRTILGSYR